MHLPRQTLPVAEALSVHEVGTGLQLLLIVELVGDIQDIWVRPGTREEPDDAL